MAGPPAVTAKLGAVNSGAVNSVLLPLRQVRGDHLQGDRDADADDDGRGGADPDLAKRVPPPLLAQERGDDPDDQRRLQALTQPDHECRQHALSPVP